ncbi:MAG: hypothetical protein Q9171_006781 [Xanthocarpia ochracea]
MAASNIQCDTRSSDLRKPLLLLSTSALNTRRPRSGPSKHSHRAKKTCQDSPASTQPRVYQEVSPASTPRLELYTDAPQQIRQSSVSEPCPRVPKTKPDEVQELVVPSVSTSSFDLLGSVGEEVESGPATVTSYSTTSSKRIGPYNTNFRSSVLAPRGISFKLAQDFTSPWQHFESAAPKGNAASYYDGLHPGIKELWLDADEGFLADVVQEYQYMHNTRCCEAEFVAYAKEHLVKGTKRYLPTDLQVTRHFRSVRMLELVSKPQEPTWKVPPIVHLAMHAETYDFDIRPDCAYWLSHAGFNPNYASLISLRVRLIELHGISYPYLFTEFKRDGKSTSTVENQLATVASLALLNRFHLRLDRIAKAAST